jgi:hypothetical protein
MNYAWMPVERKCINELEITVNQRMLTEEDDSVLLTSSLSDFFLKLDKSYFQFKKELIKTN